MSFTLGDIRNYILTYFPDLLWWDGFHKHETFNGSRSYKHRQGMPNEIRIEFDSDDTNNNWCNIAVTASKLIDLKYNFAIFSVEGGRSPHIHIYDLDELEELDYEQRNLYREKFLNFVCPNGSNPDKGLCDEKHLCALEFVPHFKHKNPKKLLNTFSPSLRNGGIELNLKLEVLHGKKKVKKEIKKIDRSQMKFGDRLRENKRDAIISNLNFETVLDKYNVDYKGHMAMCPFHADGDASLSFNNELGLWKCFGCHEKGDIITMVKLLKERENGNKK